MRRTLPGSTIGVVVVSAVRRAAHLVFATCRRHRVRPHVAAAPVRKREQPDRPSQLQLEPFTRSPQFDSGLIQRNRSHVGMAAGVRANVESLCGQMPQVGPRHVRLRRSAPFPIVRERFRRAYHVGGDEECRGQAERVHDWCGGGCVVQIPVVERDCDEPLRRPPAREPLYGIAERRHPVGLAQVLHLLTEGGRPDRRSIVCRILHLVIGDHGQASAPQPRRDSRPRSRHPRRQVRLHERVLDDRFHARH